ncbi:MAG: NAD-dependent epimerase/dehydratase family protein [Verrucomicrobia bacterium]|nr:NAD-dependent epimerase/dehydratase family protein [Verrucomicrobiota bacterium]
MSRAASPEFSRAVVLVVGGAGFVGSNLVQRLLGEGAARVVVVDNLLSAERENLPGPPAVEFREGSITDDRVLAALGDEFDYVFHLATYHGNQSSIADPLADHENNTLTTLKLFERIKGFQRLKRVVYSGAGCAVSEKTFDKARATSEDAPVSLVMDSPYSISKIIGEFYSVYYHRQHGLPVVRARFQNVYGPGEVLGAGRWRGTPATVWRNVTPTFIYRALKKAPLPLENEGRATRDFIFVEDIARGLTDCARRGKPGDVYNLASGIETSIRRLAEIINRLAGSDTPPQVAPARPWDHSGCRFGSPEKAKRDLGFEAAVSLEDGLNRTIGWTQANLPFIERCMAKHREHMDLSTFLGP